MNELIKIDVSFEYAPKVYIYKREKAWSWKFKLPNGAWFYSVAPGGDERSVKKNASLKEREIAKGLFNQKEINKLHESSNSLLTFSDAVEKYIEYLKLEGASPNYIECIEKQLVASTRELVDMYSLKYVHKLTEENAYSYRDYLLRRVKMEEIKKVTSFRILNDVKRLFKWLKKRKKISKDPWRDIDGITVSKSEKARVSTPGIELINKLMSVDYEHRFEFPVKEFMYGLFRTGARKEELLYLEVEDVDWSTGHWLIKPKRCPIRHGLQWAPKYAKKRMAIIPQDVLARLKPLRERALNNMIVGYSPDKNGKAVAVEANFIFTMLDRKKTKKFAKKKVYRRVDSIAGAWGALFVAAGLVKPNSYISESTAKYKGGEKVRKDIKPLYTMHDMRRGFNVAAKNAGLSLDDRALLLGHSREVNESNYCGRPDIDTQLVSEFINEKMAMPESLYFGIKEAI